MTTPLQSPAAAMAALPLDSGATAATNTYTDINGLAALKKDPNSPQALRAVAQQVDALFLQMMLQSMREASAEISGTPASNEMSMYQDMFDKQIALTLSQHQGLGLGTALTRQMGHASAKPAAAPATTVPGALRPPVTRAATVAPSAPDIAAQAAKFVSEVLPTIRSAAQALGVDPLGMLAQAALETGWGQRMPAKADRNAASGGLPGLRFRARKRQRFHWLAFEFSALSGGPGGGRKRSGLCGRHRQCRLRERSGVFA